MMLNQLNAFLTPIPFSLANRYRIPVIGLIRIFFYGSYLDWVDPCSSIE